MKVEAQVLKPMWHEGKPIDLVEGEAGPIISLEKTDAAYLQSLGRVRIVEIEADEAVEVVAKKASKAKAAK
ncbi:MAG: hypothetical protein ACEQSK_11000 [Sphingomonadaceae bacterium]|jgi:hypothetical protein